MVTPIDQLNMGLLPMRSTQPRGVDTMGSSLLGVNVSPLNVRSQLAAAAQPTALGRVRGALEKNIFDPAMLRGLASGLLTGPTRTPVSMGQRLTTGLLAGQQMKEAEEERRLKQGLLQREMDLATRKIELEEAKLQPGLEKGKSVNVLLPSGDTVFGIERDTGEVLVKGVDGQLAPAPFGSRKVSLSVEAGGLSDLIPAAQELASRGVDLNKDTEVLPDGTVQVVPGSKTAEELNLKQLGLQLKNDQFQLSEEQFNTATKFKERELAIQEGKAAREDSLAKLNYDKANFAFQQEQNIEARKKEDAFSEAFEISTTINDILNLAERYGEENVFGPDSIISKAPIFGLSTPQGMVAAKLQTLDAQLVKRAMTKFREGSTQGATGFGALNEKELQVIQSLFTNLQQAQGGPQIMENLRRLKTGMDALAYGVVNNGKYEDFIPSLHKEGLLGGSILPATKQNSYLIGAPSVPGYTFKQFSPVGRPVFINKQGEPVFLEGY